ncbi:hypothetical protein PoB_005706600 [Plakobranchus ocellatus]|uniref:Uncharacterized protein n=1 Tax=Plakobranchus ocellatus TaxID=259542 RepID=A0AAV4CCT4_9GAST|nr:hypothetical protein PoB_005706600 [Plakobranchus ocellatus]
MDFIYPLMGSVGGTVASESALRSAGTILSRVRAPPPAPWPDGGPESLRSPCCGLYKKPKTKPTHGELNNQCFTYARHALLPCNVTAGVTRQKDSTPERLWSQIGGRQNHSGVCLAVTKSTYRFCLATARLTPSTQKRL